MVGEVIRWTPIALMLVPGWRGWRQIGHVMALLDHETDTPMPWVVRRRTVIMQRSVGQLQVCLGLYLMVSGTGDAVVLLLFGSLMWAFPGLFGGMLWEYERDHKEPIGPEPYQPDHDEPIGPVDLRLAEDGVEIDWDTCVLCQHGIAPLDQNGVPYWTKIPMATGDGCRPGEHRPARDVPPEDREALEEWLDS